LDVKGVGGLSCLEKIPSCSQCLIFLCWRIPPRLKDFQLGLKMERKGKYALIQYLEWKFLDLEGGVEGSGENIRELAVWGCRYKMLNIY
jgi:hypothetical protein